MPLLSCDRVSLCNLSRPGTFAICGLAWPWTDCPLDPGHVLGLQVHMNMLGSQSPLSPKCSWDIAKTSFFLLLFTASFLWMVSSTLNPCLYLPFHLCNLNFEILENKIHTFIHSVNLSVNIDLIVRKQWKKYSFDYKAFTGLLTIICGPEMILETGHDIYI